MRTRLILSALMLSASALACNDEMPPPVTPPPPPVAPITTVVIDAGAPIAAPVVTAAAVDAGTTSAAADPPDAAAPSTSASGPDFFSCTTASDCVAVAKNDCCKNGFKEAVNKSSVDAYKASAPKCDPRRKCPMFRIMDKRTPDCSSGKCVLVQPSP